jgi:hypothetical protein
MRGTIRCSRRLEERAVVRVANWSSGESSRLRFRLGLQRRRVRARERAEAARFASWPRYHRARFDPGAGFWVCALTRYVSPSTRRSISSLKHCSSAVASSRLKRPKMPCYPHAARQTYQNALAPNIEWLGSRLRDEDVVILHDRRLPRWHPRFRLQLRR